MFHDPKHVISGDAVIMWDSVTRPDTDEKSGAIIHALKVALPNGDPTLAELGQLAQNSLNESEFKGQLPHGGSWPFIPVDPGAHDGMLPAHTAFNTKTRRGAPQVFDANGGVLTPMQYSSFLYPGAIVRVFAHAYDFNKSGNKGIAFGLDGIQIIRTDTPKLPGGGIDAAVAFGPGGTAAAPGVPAAAPALAPPAIPGAAPAPGMLPPPAAYAPTTAAPAAAPAYVPPAAPVAAPPAAPDFLQPGGGQAAAKPMTAKAVGTTYAQFIAAGWTDAQLVEQGYMLADGAIPF